MMTETTDLQRFLSIPASWMSRRASTPAAVRRKLERLPAALVMIDAMHDGDELRSYCSPRAGWAHRVGVRGYVVLRECVIVARIVTART